MSRAPRTGKGELERLARAFGVQSRYEDSIGRVQTATPEALFGVLRALGAPVAGPDDIADALRERTRALWSRPLEPVVVAWDGRATTMLRLDGRYAEGIVACRLEREDGTVTDWKADLGDSSAAHAETVDGREHVARELALPDELPEGYHRLTVELGAGAATALVVSAPSRLEIGRRRDWGVFLPVYALRTERNLGGGDLTDLRALMEWVREIGGDIVATLPMLAAFLDEPYEPSPYSPASRLFWNEVYVDVERAPELRESPEARAILDDPETRRAVQEMRAADAVDWRRLAALKRRVLEPLAERFFAAGPPPEYERFARENPLLDDYARFRAECERRGTVWREWPEPARDGRLDEGDGPVERLHRYGQWLAHSQLEALGREAGGGGLYLDMPIGVHRDGYDVWRERRSFAVDASAGAPPDAFFATGQNWSFPPMHPERIREEGLRYPIACFRRMLGAARILRVDHIMGLHRLWWVPEGHEASDGAYVRYPVDELYAVLVLEARRADALVVGEDLGTVPTAVRRTMRRRGILRSYVLQEELTDDDAEPMNPVPATSMATLNTHDMPPFPMFWRADDVDERFAMGFFDREGADEERRTRASRRQAIVARLVEDGYLTAEDVGRGDALPAVTRALLERLAASPARAVVAQLEDLWGEERRQNLPGTGVEKGNWTRKTRYALDEIRDLPAVREALDAVRRRREEGGAR